MLAGLVTDQSWTESISFFNMLEGLVTDQAWTERHLRSIGHRSQADMCIVRTFFFNMLVGLVADQA